MDLTLGFLIGFFAWFIVRVIVGGIYTVDQNERAVKTRFGRAERLPGTRPLSTIPSPSFLRDEERPRYTYPQVRVIPPGGPYLKMPWEKVHKIRIATTTINMALDLEDPQRQRRRNPARGRHQGSAQHRTDRPDPLPREREEPVRLPVRNQEAASST